MKIKEVNAIPKRVNKNKYHKLIEDFYDSGYSLAVVQESQASVKALYYGIRAYLYRNKITDISVITRNENVYLRREHQ